jgi:thiol:disulfide interchange protein DsbA
MKLNLAALRWLFAALFFTLAWNAPAHAELVMGKQYTLISPAEPTETGKNIEVLEFFSYACPHCNDLEPTLNPWVKKLPKDVTFRRLPAVFNDTYMIYAKIFYTAEAMGMLDKLHPAIFNAVHVQRINLANEQTLLEWVAKQGVDSQKFSAMYASFSVMSKTQRAKQLTRAFAISGVPSVAVEGKYLTSPAQANGNEQLLPVLDDLINKVRQERGGKS